ncbi:hypothetical protein LWP59_33865 [Amycolatopsis acidiphila]|uniref:Uncharacterized protein n=1 Tax=Amycolatopsis acidiphila TaxID=715473 RepID=A0A558A8X1_9PSEU|nr:hypothetical protein [Amycolatopsis acidiphila]TVT20707.1 hypothetical protein FNH06_19520 [Amycolatopsis acidiphila]UIJ59009.1 hypothetical protein LWP59_33865 [Amycolatopsis acidiphila]
MSPEKFISEAKRRGFDLNPQTMRKLYRHRLLIPFVWVQNEPDRCLAASNSDEPHPNGTLLIELRLAREAGKLRDLAAMPFRPQLPFARQARFTRRWWDGLIYSWHQLHVLSAIAWVLDGRRETRRDGKWRVALPAPGPYLVDEAAGFRRIAIAATALDARYGTKLDPDFVHLSNTTFEQWSAYRASFDPLAVGDALGYSAEQAAEDAESLLTWAAQIDPLGRAWGRLARRAPRKAWEQLKGPALAAMDMRQTAEILLLFYEDLAGRGLAEPLAEPSSMSTHPMRERLSRRDSRLDQDLMSLGLSPHPRVVLAVEGESEQLHVPKIAAELGYRDAPELVRVLHLGGTTKDLQKVAALAVAPLIAGRKTDDHWELLKPPTCLMVAVDPEGKFAADKWERTREGILDEIRQVLRAQGAKTTEEELSLLVDIHRWSASCYEFAHFTDDELADALMAIHKTVNGLSRDDLIGALAALRKRARSGHHNVDIKNVWWDWNYEPSKVNLAEQLWPVLKQKIDRCREDEEAPIPEIVRVVEKAYRTALHWRDESFVLTAVD